MKRPRNGGRKMAVGTEWYWFPQQRPEEIAFLKCYDSVSDGEMSRWSFHTSCIVPGVPRDARKSPDMCHRNIADTCHGS